MTAPLFEKQLSDQDKHEVVDHPEPADLIEDLADDDTDTAGSEAGPGPAPHWRLSVPLAGALLAVALVFLTVAAVSWWGETHDRASSDAAARDAVIKQTRIAVATLNTVDFHEPAASLQRWGAVTTAALHDQIAQGSSTVAKEIAAAKVSTTGVVLAAAVTTLDVEHGTATVIASVQLTKTPDAGTAVVDRNRMKASLVRVGSVWKIADLTTVAVQLR